MVSPPVRFTKLFMTDADERAEPCLKGAALCFLIDGSVNDLYKVRRYAIM